RLPLRVVIGGIVPVLGSKTLGIAQLVAILDLGRSLGNQWTFILDLGGSGMGTPSPRQGAGLGMPGIRDGCQTASTTMSIGVSTQLDQTRGGAPGIGVGGQW